MPATDISSREPAMLKGMVKMKASIIAALLMTYPLAIIVDVRGFRMPFFVCVMILLRCLLVAAARVSSRTMGGNKTTTHLVAPAAASMLLATVLVAPLSESKRSGRHCQTGDCTNLQ
jgi:hypothetical protein